MSLYAHQREGADWLNTRSRAYLGDKPGMGKTRTLLHAYDQLNTSGRVLVACPAIVRTHWQREATHIGLEAERVAVRSYDELTRGGFELMRVLLGNGTDALVLDEAHYLKHASSARTKLLLGRNGYAPRLPTVYAASGTPVPKHAGEFWTVLSSLFPAVALDHGLRTYNDFTDRFCDMHTIRSFGGRMTERARTGIVKNMAEFQAILDSVMFVREPGADMPSLDIQVLRLDGATTGLSDDASDAVGRLLRKNTWDESLADVADEPHIARMRRRLGKLKVGPVLSLLKQIQEDSSEQVVVFAHHRDVLTELRFGLGLFGVSYVDGDTSQHARNEAIDRFQRGESQFFIGQNIACQTGITLTAAHRMLLVEPDWTAAVNLQLAHRIRRIGQASAHCTVQMVALAGTLDESIVAQNARETRMLIALDQREKMAA